ncbi:LysR family transcriptional regulator [Cognatishimia sp. WU-CL00825]|uniref:LysR family transcriptional regulator n=1 Tax=Cognatishimia sp. WU-CL00825 TaxID=3127658 RepID=UPI00310232EA
MDRVLLTTFLDLVESRNFNRTADNLDITQSTVSNRIQTLEKDIGAVLFERGRGGATPTASGLLFATHARQLLASWTHAVRDIGVRKGHDRLLRLSAQLSLQRSILGDWALALRRDNPRIALDLQADYSAQIMRDVAAGHADIGVLYAPQMQPDVRVRKEGDEIFHMMSSYATTLDQVKAAKYFKVGYTDAFSRSHEAALPDLSSTSISMGNETVALDLMSKEGGTAYLPARFGTTKGGQNLHRVKDAPVIKQPIYSVIHRNRKSDHDVAKALAILRQIFHDT